MLEWWTKRSFDPSSGVIKPYPFESLNHLTVPLAMKTPPLRNHERVGKAPWRKPDSLLVSDHGSSEDSASSAQPRDLGRNLCSPAQISRYTGRARRPSTEAAEALEGSSPTVRPGHRA